MNPMVMIKVAKKIKDKLDEKKKEKEGEDDSSSVSIQDTSSDLEEAKKGYEG
jgi:hypothetical protein